MPLDATNHAPLAKYFYRALKDQHATPGRNGCLQTLAKPIPISFSLEPTIGGSGGCGHCDGRRIGKFETKRLSVIEAEGEESGRTKWSMEGRSIRVADVGRRARVFEEVFLSTLNGGKAVTIDRTHPTPAPTAKMSVAIEDDKCTYSGPKNCDGTDRH